jgi:hypothetical protein
MEYEAIEGSLFKLLTNFEMPVKIRTRILTYLGCQATDACEFCSIDIDPERLSVPDGAFICEENVGLVGSDGLGPIANSVAGRSIQESLQNRRSTSLYFLRHKEDSSCKFIVFRHVPSSERDKEKTYLVYNSSTIDQISPLISGNVQSEGGFWYGRFVYPKKSIIGEDDDQVHIEESVWKLIADNTVNFLSSDNQKRFLELGVKPKRGVLLSGRPGTGKTAISRIIMRKMMLAGVNCVFLDPQSIRARHMSFLDLYRSAVNRAPVLIVIDDLDLFFSDRNFQEGHNILADMLQALDGMQGNTGVVTLASTNDFKGLDPALTRPGRFDIHVEVEATYNLNILFEIVCRQFKGMVPSEQSPFEKLLGLTPAQVVECCNRLKLEIVLKGKKYSWDGERFNQILEAFQADLAEDGNE